MHRHRLAALPVVAIALAVAIGCGRTDRDVAPDDRDTAPVRGGRLVLALDADPGTLNPLRMRSAQSARVYGILQPGLFRLDPETGDWHPALVASWDFGADSTTVDLELDRSYRWSDGAPFVAADVVTSLSLYRDPRTGYARTSQLDPVSAVEAVDEGTVRVTFADRVFDPFFVISHVVLPHHVVATAPRDSVDTWEIGREPVTLGAYRLVSWESNASLLLARSDRARPGEAWVDEIEVVVRPDAGARVLGLRTGEIDVVDSVPLHLVEGLADEPGVDLRSVTGRSVAFLQCNLQRPGLDDPAVREAISLAIDRDAIVRGPLFGFAVPAASLVPPVSWAYADELSPDPYDVDRARELLDAAGHPVADDGRRPGLRFELLLRSGDSAREAVASVLLRRLADVGIEIVIRPMEMGALLREASTGDFDLHLAQLSGPVGADVSPFLTSAGRFNFGAFSDPRVDELSDAAASALDRASARTLSLRLQERVAASRPVIPLFHPATVVGVRSRVHGAAPTWLSPFDRIESWWVID